MWAVGARAQEDDAPAEQAEHHEGRPDHAKMAEMMKKRLELTDEQAAKFGAAMKAHGEAMKPLWGQVKEAMKKLGGQLKAKAPDAEIQASLDSLKAARKAIADEEEKFRDSLASFLTPTQRAKMLMGMIHMRRERMEHGPRGKRGPKEGAAGAPGGDEKGGGSDE